MHTPQPPASVHPGSAVATLNTRAWAAGDYVAGYATRGLRPAEVMLLVRHHDALGGRVLELGCGAGRITGYLVALGGEVLGIDVSSAMVDHCRRRYPAATFEVRDLRDLGEHADGAFDAIVGGFAVIDVLGHAERRALLGELHRLLRPDGVLLFSSHNLAHAPALAGPVLIWPRDPLRMVRSLTLWPRRMRNRRRMRRLERHEGDHALLNDEGLNFAAVHYYIDGDAQARQLAEHGFELLERTDLEGEILGPGDLAPECPELHYVAARRSAGWAPPSA